MVLYIIIRIDYTNLNSSNLPNFSSNWNNDSNTSTFQLNVNNSTSNTNSNISTHLTFSNKIKLLKMPYLLVKYNNKNMY